MIAQLTLFDVPPEPRPRCDCGADLMNDEDWFIWGEFGDWQCRACYAAVCAAYVSRRKEPTP